MLVAKRRMQSIALCVGAAVALFATIAINEAAARETADASRACKFSFSNKKQWGPIQGYVTDATGISCAAATRILKQRSSLPRNSRVVRIPDWSCSRAGSYYEAVFVRCVQGSRRIQISTSGA